MIVLISFTICLAGAVGEPNERSQKAPVVRRPRAEAVTMAEFYMRDGNAVSGRLLSEDNTQIVIEQPMDSTLVTRNFSKREMDARTLKTRPMPESQYYTRLAEYFAARTWDFRDDPDDFIAAIRSYEKAKRSLEASGADGERIAEIDRAIKKLEEDREVWTREVEPRAKLKKLEYEAEAENRLKQLEKQVAESNVRLNESIKYLDKTAADIKNDYERLEKTVSGLNKDFVQQIRNLDLRIQSNVNAINDIWFNCCFRPRPGPRSEGG
jgi:archaellum component FlaC